jgi:hypothetical protein
MYACCKGKKRLNRLLMLMTRTPAAAALLEPACRTDKTWHHRVSTVFETDKYEAKWLLRNVFHVMCPVLVAGADCLQD